MVYVFFLDSLSIPSVPRNLSAIRYVGFSYLFTTSSAQFMQPLKLAH